jgi:hypothetical protein
VARRVPFSIPFAWLQIITVNETGDAFTLHEKKVKQVLDQVRSALQESRRLDRCAFIGVLLLQIPEDLHIAVLSVVGAFRTGKSFLLDLFLRYLRFYDERPDGTRCCSLDYSMLFLTSLTTRLLQLCVV